MARKARSDRQETQRVYAIRPGRPVVRTVYHLAATLDLEVGSTKEGADRARAIVVRWLKQKFPRRLPARADRGESIELDSGNHRLEVIGIPEAGLWCARLMQPDTAFKGKPGVAGRSWITDVSIQRRDKEVAVGVRVQCASTPDSVESFQYTRPRIVPDWGKGIGLRTSRPLRDEPWTIDGAGDLERLQELIADRDRELPVVVLTQPDHKKSKTKLSPWVLDPKEVGRRLYGLAHVVLLPWEKAFGWTRLVGRTWSVFGGAVRIYHTGPAFGSASPTAHPVFTVDRIMATSVGELRCEAAFTQQLVNDVFATLAKRRIRWGDRYFVLEARALAAAAERRRIAAQIEAEYEGPDRSEHLQAQMVEMEAAHEREVVSLREEVEAAREEAERWSDESIQTGQDLDEQRKHCADLRTQVSVLRMRLRDRDGDYADAGVAIPDDYEGLDDWVSEHLAGRLYLHNRAHQSLKDAAYERPADVYRGLLLLGNTYRDMKLGLLEKDHWEAALADQQLHCSASISENQAGRYGDTYFVRWPIGKQTRRFIELHLRNNGNTRDPARCLAIYFFWDADEQQVVVCWLPGHLKNQLT